MIINYRLTNTSFVLVLIIAVILELEKSNDNKFTDLNLNNLFENKISV